METATYTIKLADGTEFIGLGLNGNNFVSPTEITEDVFEGKLSRVEITGGGTTTVLLDAELVQIAHYADGWYFILREVPKAEKREKLVNEALDDIYAALTELGDIIAGEG
ncbi:MAG: hypothetical protein IKG04_03335 [Exiguobacterium sp.]|nr:hypothetical protein [Exiguobacterium sp.]